MKNLNQKILVRPRIALGVLFSAVISTVVFQNCSKGVLQDNTNLSANSVPQITSNAVGVVTMRQVYNSMLSVTKNNIGTSSISATDVANLTSPVSGTGDPSSVNGPNWMAITSLSGLGCIDVMASEANLQKAGSAPNFLTKVNLWATPPMIQDAQIQDSASHFARAYWGRNLTSDESATILAAMSASFSDIRAPAGNQTAGNPKTDPVNAGTNRMMYFLCMAMLSSMDTHKRVTSN